ncbi:aldose 1-epimerase family protein [Saccharopolyspora hattusasensis]|uniref:aldose 1-epimerase family protein n=1 Tax=Saccharopolyspora hattusasensis TaxID=1128679 RepID=UPI003D988946
MIRLESSALRVAVATRGAELQSLRSLADGHEHLWQAGPEWPRHAPWLFPAICRVPEDRIEVAGRSWPMPGHGFARDLDFRVDELDARSAVLSLHDSPRTHRHYPCRFSLSIRYELVGTAVLVHLTAANRDRRSMPFSLGFHPAFAWPLDTAPGPHAIAFERPEVAPTRRVTDNLLREELFEPAAPNGSLALDRAHFADGAVILEQAASRGIRYESPSGRAVEMDWTGFDALAIWSPPDGDLLCVEPWRGLPARIGASSDFASRPDLTTLAPGEAAEFTVRIRLHPAR